MRDADDKQEPRTETFDGIKSKSDAEYLDKRIEEVTGALNVPTAEPTFSEAWERYKTLKTPNWSTSSRKTIDGIMRLSGLPVGGGYRVRDLTPDPLQAVLNRMAEKDFSHSAITKARIYIKAILEYAVEERIIDRNPVGGKRKLQVPPTKKHCDRFLSLEEIERLLSAAGRRDHAIVRLFLVGGLRPSEEFAVRNNDLEPSRIRIDEAIKQAEKGDRPAGPD